MSGSIAPISSRRPPTKKWRGARELQRRLYAEQGKVFFSFSLDAFALEHLPSAFLANENKLVHITPSLVHAFHRSIRAVLESGHSVIIDHVLQEQWWAEDLFSCLADIKVLSIQVTAPLNVLEERERKRGDRSPGIAAFQYQHMHFSHPYDLQVNTSTQDLDTCVRNILASQKRS